MKKLTLTVESLQVETFETSDPAGARGTVRGNDTASNDTWCEAYGCVSTQLQIVCTCTVQPENSCDYSCQGTCNYENDTCSYLCEGYSYDAHCPTAPAYLGCRNV
jgi:hypothetical protein